MRRLTIVLLILLTITLAHRAFPVKADIPMPERIIKYQGVNFKLHKQSNIERHFKEKGIYRKNKKVKLKTNKKGELIWDEVLNITVIG